MKKKEFVSQMYNYTGMEREKVNNWRQQIAERRFVHCDWGKELSWRTHLLSKVLDNMSVTL